MGSTVVDFECKWEVYTHKGSVQCQEWQTESSSCLHFNVVPKILPANISPDSLVLLQVDAVELNDSGPNEMAAILQEMGQHYNPRRLAAALEGRQLQTNVRALRITFTLGKFITKIAKVNFPPAGFSADFGRCKEAE